jgi:hypothetical protein
MVTRPMMVFGSDYGFKFREERRIRINKRNTIEQPGGKVKLDEVSKILG